MCIASAMVACLLFGVTMDFCEQHMFGACNNSGMEESAIVKVFCSYGVYMDLQKVLNVY